MKNRTNHIQFLIVCLTVIIIGSNFASGETFDASKFDHLIGEYKGYIQGGSKVPVYVKISGTGYKPKIEIQAFVNGRWRKGELNDPDFIKDRYFPVIFPKLNQLWISHTEDFIKSIGVNLFFADDLYGGAWVVIKMSTEHHRIPGDFLQFTVANMKASTLSVPGSRGTTLIRAKDFEIARKKNKFLMNFPRGPY